MSSKLFHVVNSENDFTEEISKKGVCVVDFFAKWCGPCKDLSNELIDIVEKDMLLQKARFIKVDVDYFVELAEMYDVFALPYIIFFKDGKQTEYFVKGNNKNEVIETVKQLLKS